jgi:F-type H+-transporting ATPase subunit b
MIKIISLATLSLFTLNTVFAAEAGMPQLDPTYWASQVFWLTVIFSAIYFLIAKVFVPKIKGNIDARESQIRKDIDEANSLKEEADKKLKKYNNLINEAKLEAKKILSEGRIKINEEIQLKKESIEKDIQKETLDATKEIEKFKINSFNKANIISEEIVSEIVKDIFKEDLNKSSIQATISEVMKERKY